MQLHWVRVAFGIRWRFPLLSVVMVCGEKPGGAVAFCYSWLPDFKRRLSVVYSDRRLRPRPQPGVKPMALPARHARGQAWKQRHSASSGKDDAKGGKR